MREAEVSDQHLQILTFQVGGEEFGLDVLAVQQVVRQAPLAPLPEAPLPVQGTLEVRGVRVPVIDLRRHFQLRASGGEGEGRVIVIQAAQQRLGVIVDAVREVVRLPLASIAPPPSYFRGLAVEYIRGIARLEERLVILLESERILSAQERRAVAEAMEWSGTEEDSFAR